MVAKHVLDLRFSLLAQVWALNDDFWGWSLTELADEAGLAPATVYRLYNEETKDCRSSTLIKLILAVKLHIYLKGKDAKINDLIRRAA